jgi:hypothetical protein
LTTASFGLFGLCSRQKVSEGGIKPSTVLNTLQSLWLDSMTYLREKIMKAVHLI